MSKILIVIHNMECGGVQSALIEFLKRVSQNNDVYLECFSHHGELMKDIPESVMILPEKQSLSILGLRSNYLFKNNKFLYGLKIIFNLLAKIFGGVLSHNIYYINKKSDVIYDYAISYVQDVNGRSFSVGCNDYVLKCVNAQKKITFVHCDFSLYGGNDKINRSRYEKFEKIVCVSNGCKSSFIKVNPLLEKRVLVLRNFIDNYKIVRLSQIDTIKFDSNNINIVTVARLSEEKGLVRAINVLKDIVYKYEINNVKWFLVGDGPEREKILAKITEYNLLNHIFLLGQTNNPYRVMANADFLFLPSFHECAPVVFDEALCLKVPILTTLTISAKEMVGEHGFVCENSECGLIEGLLYMCSHFNDYKKLISKSQNKINSFDFESFVEGKI